MKNLKKILSLVLALAMALSLMTVAFAKDTGDFADGDDVTYVEAVDVMSTIGVFNGVGDGSNFDPNGTLTREQAAKIITYMIMGQAQADKLVATIAPFADVSADRWSAGAIAYCASEGIMNGTGNGKFNPTGELTGLQFAKMLLVALGYDAEIEQMTGAAWGLATSKLAYAVELDDGMDGINLTAPMTREQAAQMAFTTMKTPMVQYPSKGSTISVNGAVVEFGAQKAEYVTADITTGTKNSSNIDNKVLSDGSALIEFGERYCKDLVKTNEVSYLEQPLREWSYKNDVIGDYVVNEEKLVVVSAKDKTLADIVTGKSFMNYSNNDLNVRKTPSGDPAYNDVYLNGDEVTSASWDTQTLNKGDIVYAYEDSAGKVDRIVVASYSLAKIESVATNMSATEKENGAEYRVKLVELDGDGIGNTNYYDDYNDDTKLLNGFVSATYTADTILAVALKDDNSVVDSYVAEIVTGKPTAAKETGDGHITVDGTKYNFVTDKDSTVLIDGVYQNFDFDNEYHVYTTKEGYVIGIEGAEATKIDDLYYVTGIYSDTVGGETSYYAQRVALIDGKVDTVQIEKGSVQILVKANSISGIDGNIGGTGKSFAGLYTFNDRKYDEHDAGTGNADKQNSSNNILTMIPFSKTALHADAQDIYGSAYAAEDFAVNGNTGLLSAGGTLDAKLEKADTKMSVGGENYYMNADTQYVAVDGVGSAIDVTLATGGMNVTKDSNNALVVTDKDDTKTVLAFVIAGTGLTVSAASKDVVYVPANTTERYGNDNYRNDLWFMKDGTKTEGAVITAKESQGFYTYSENDGVYKLESNATNIRSLVPSTDNFTYDDESGYGVGLSITSAYSKNNVNYVEIATLANVNGTYGLIFGAVKLNGVTITDLRSSSDMKGDVYKIEISSISDLKNAAKEGDVTADVYFNEGVTFIAITDVEDEVSGETLPATSTVAEVAAALANGDVTIEGPWTADDDLTVADNNLTVEGGITATDHTITVNTGKTLTVDGAIATGNGNITVNGTLTGATTIDTTGTVTVDGSLTATGKITSGVLTLTSGTLNAGEIDTSAANSDIVVTAGTLTSTGAVDAGTGDITVAGTLTATDQAVTAGTLAVTTGTATVGAVTGNATVATGTLTAGAVSGNATVATGTLTAGAVSGTLAMTGAGRATVDSVGGNDLASGDITNFAGATITIVDAVTADSAATTEIALGTWNFTGMFTTDGTNATTVAAATTANFNGGITFDAADMLKAADAVDAVMTVGNVTSTTNASETLICNTDGSTPLTSTDIKGLTFKGTADTNNKWAKQAP